MRGHTVEAPKKFEKSVATTKVRQFVSSVYGYGCFFYSSLCKVPLAVLRWLYPCHIGHKCHIFTFGLCL